MYDTPHGAEHRTFELEVASSYDSWLLTTVTAWAGEALWRGPLGHFRPVRMKMTFRPHTIELTELQWLIERVLAPTEEERTAYRISRAESSKERPLRLEVLTSLAKHVQDYLLLHFDVVAMVKDLAPTMDRAYFNVAAWNLPSPADDPVAFEQHLRIYRNCLRLAYVDDTYEL